MRKHANKFLHEAEELNITAFMNLMVILVPFLLITAVFSRITVLELNLPNLDDPQQETAEIKLSLELVLRETRFDIQDANLGVITSFERTEDSTRWDRFGEILLEIKRRFPDEREITLLVEPAVDYRTLITVMDHVRSIDVLQGLSVETVELFPEISLGDASLLSGPGAADTEDSIGSGGR
jgi:biopolymer transport protein ExbD